MQFLAHLVFLTTLLGSTVARIYIFDDGQPETQAAKERHKRDTDQVFLQNNTPLRQSELEASPRAVRQAKSQNLGYEASDILSPPELKTAESQTQYRTLRYRRIEEPGIVWGKVKQGAVVSRPRSHRSLQEGNIGVTTIYYAPKHSKRQAQSEEYDSEEERGSQEDEDEEEESSEDAGSSQQGHEFHQVPASIYSFVKTDPDDYSPAVNVWTPYEQPPQTWPRQGGERVRREHHHYPKGDIQGAASGNQHYPGDIQEAAASVDRVRRDHHQGVTGPVHTFVKTDKHAHFKWGVKHNVGHEYAG